ncbi:MAG: DUF6504 family protein [Actinomycetes bacterium]|jgi:hypothetical protein
MFEQSSNPAAASGSVPEARPALPQVLAPEGEPVEFIYKGHRFHIHNILSRWQESGGWWNRISDGNLHDSKHLEQSIFNDGGRAIWRVEAAPVGALATFEIELDELTGKWIIRPTSRPA